MGSQSPFEVLSVEPGAEEADIRRAYRERVKEVHPDQGGSTRQFRRVKAAYEAILSGAADPDLEFDEEPGAPGTGPETTDGRTPADEHADPRPAVEYLNYDVLRDRGWNLTDDHLFEKARDADLAETDHGTLRVDTGDTLLQAAEDDGFAWPYSCRGGACANCAVAVLDGELSLPANHILSEEMTDRGFRLSCVGAPVTDDLKLVFNVKHLPGLDELRLPPDPYEAGLDD